MEGQLDVSAPVVLTARHRLDGFESGSPPLDDWLRRRAWANQIAGASRTYVACAGDRVVAYYALASGGLAASTATGRFRRNMPDPIPVAILGRLAVDRTLQGRGFGRALFQDAARRVIQAADLVGIRGLLVHAISEEARRFYLGLGLEPSPLDPMTLFVTLADLRAAEQAAEDDGGAP